MELLSSEFTNPSRGKEFLPFVPPTLNASRRHRRRRDIGRTTPRIRPNRSFSRHSLYPELIGCYEQHVTSSLASHGATSGIGGGGGKGDALGSSDTYNDGATAASPRKGSIGHSSAPAAATPGALASGKKRNVAVAGLDSSPGSTEDVEDGEPHEEKRRQPVKRACNECRQQKVSSVTLVSRKERMFGLYTALKMRQRSAGDDIWRLQ